MLFLRVFLVIPCVVIFLALPARAGEMDRWATLFEQSGGTRTPRYDETVAYCRRLAKASPLAAYSSFGTSPQGRELPCMILSSDRAYSPLAASRTGKPVILIQSCIHAGESDGKDASLMLMREILVTGRLRLLLDHAILLVVPIFNVDGHERFGPLNRINQNGPEEMGWRVTSQNLNLNRDYMKADAPEMRAMLRLFNNWLPDLYVDCHVTDGIDFQYDVTYAVETGPNTDAGVSGWVVRTLMPHALQVVKASGYKAFYYVWPREDNDMTRGLNGGAATPRFSTGYAALQNRAAVLIETHMLKPYRTRVRATFSFLKGLIEGVNESAGEVRRLARDADMRTVAHGRPGAAPYALPLKMGLSETSAPKTFLGVRSHTEQGAVSGVPGPVYTSEETTMTVPFYDIITVEDSAFIPAAYIIPPEWTFAREILALHGVKVSLLSDSMSLDIESYRFSESSFAVRPYEGRQTVTMKTWPVRERRTFQRGSVVVRMDQRAAKVAAHLLEPRAPDSFVSWGFFNAVFEQKEYAESYVMERIGKKMFAGNPALKEEFEARVRVDSLFARDPDGRVNWLYQRSPWGDPWLGKYPVGKLSVVPPSAETRRRRPQDLARSVLR